jgi:hypothetical protein
MLMGERRREVVVVSFIDMMRIALSSTSCFAQGATSINLGKSALNVLCKKIHNDSPTLLAISHSILLPCVWCYLLHLLNTELRAL